MAAVQLFRQMRDAGVNPTMLTYSKLLFVHAAAGQWEAAVGFIEAATADGLLHNPLTLNPNPNPSPDPGPGPSQELFVLQRIANSLNLDFEDARRSIATSTRRTTRRPPRDRASSSEPSESSE